MKHEVTAEQLDTSTGFVETLSFYNGEVTLYFDHALHCYYLLDDDGTRYIVPGATTVCGIIDKSGALMGWSAKETANYGIAHLDTIVRSKIESEIPFEELLVIDRTDHTQLMMDAKAKYRLISKDATDVGHMAHDWLERWLKYLIKRGIDATDGIIDYQEPLPEEQRARNCVEAGIEWLSKHKFKPTRSESKIFSRSLGYSGTLDWTGAITSCGDPTCCPFEGTHNELGDFKSSKALYDEYRAQVASYKAAIEEEFPDEVIDGRRLLRLGKDDGAFESIYMPNSEFEADMDGFYGALRVYYWLEQIKLNKKYDKSVERAIKKAGKVSRPVRKLKVKAPPTITIEIEGQEAA